jgi:hypothetical protein
MCFNAEVSASTYIIGVIGSLMLFRRGRIPEAIFYFWVVQMQLIEYILWMTQGGTTQGGGNKEEDGVVNEIATKLGVCINHLEPIVLWIAIKMFSPKKLPVYIDAVMMVFLCLTVIYTRGVFQKDKQYTIVTPESSPHLHWKWTQGSYGREYYLGFVCVLVMLSLYGLPHGRINAVMIITSFLISYKLYGNTHSVGAMWCFSASFAPWVLLAIN